MTTSLAPSSKDFDNLPEFATGTLLKSTLSLCPGCLGQIPADVYSRDGKVWMDKTCEKCGPFSALLSSRSDEYLISKSDSEKPDTCGCGSGGCGSAIENHSCVLLVEITQKCNLACPTCYAASSPQNDHFLSLQDYDVLLDRLLENQHGDADALQISGGEPTLHPDLITMISRAYEKGFRQVYINSNGIKLSQPKFAAELGALEPKPLVYLQLDGDRPETYQILRGNNKLFDVKRRALENCEKSGIEVIPVMTLTRGVNDDQIDPFLQISANSKTVNKVMIQPAMYSGRYINPRKVNRITASDTIGLIAEQSGIFSREDFTPIPCGDPNCFRMALALRTPEGLLPISRYFPPFENWKSESISNTITDLTDTFDDASSLQKAMSLIGESEALANLPEEELDRLLDAVAAASESPAKDGWSNLFAVGIKPFMDAYTYDQDRIDTCCTHIAARDGTPVSFCQYNAINRPTGNL